LQKAIFQHSYNNLPLTNYSKIWGRRGKYNKTIKVQRGGWRSRKLSKLEKGVGGLGNFPTWKGGLKFRRN
jgi:hypothetical protein